ncbi:transcription antiterminator BglG [Bacillus sp. AFS076308]|uniref:BglG family transcription antiterminator n=1 Tax=unclassified Bacillus (in: firmicutes) TaxID=185979 RepID=UPI000BF9FBEB|nr:MULTISPECIES: PRD domain-containing protein [unclassified Bacillus (in: firmicutes)]PFN98697.1 transcription antiterminator BglG [Bacillus sp. AFS076308]PGV53523.1 transcription antiterminator BglG [Bacillus sp. AFS037270]
MNIKYRNILRHLSTQQDWTSSAQLANLLGISKRSVKTYIADINSMEKELIISSKKGYRVEIEKLTPFLNSLEKSIPQTPKERAEYLLKSLVNADGPRNIFDLSDELYISEVTLKGDLRKVKKRLADYNLELRVSGDSIEMVGPEKSKRKLMSSILYSETNDNFLDIDKLRSSFEGYDIDFIRDVIAEVFSTFHYFTNDYSLTNIILHIAIAIDRMENGFIFSKQVDGEASLEKEYKIANEIAKRLEEHFGVEYSEGEIRDLALLISSSGTSVNFMHLQLSDLQDVAGIRCLNLVGKIIEDLRSNYYIVIEDPDFLVRFTLHIKNLIMRLENDFVSKNPLTSTIKLNCPSIYDCAVHVSYTIKEETGYTMNDDEIAYVAFHLGYALEMQKQAHSKITCAILFPFYYNYNVQITEKLTKQFGEDLLIQHIVTNEGDLNVLNCDLIISAVQLNSVPKIPYVLINPFFTSVDQNKVAQKINDLKESKRKDSFKRNIEAITEQQLFEIVDFPGTKEEVLTRMCTIMEQKEFVDSSFLANVIEREAMSSTAFGRIAIPHAIKMNAKKTGMFVLISDMGIKWGDLTVNVVLLFSVSKDDRKIFHEVVDSLATIFTVDGNVSLIMNAEDYKSFVDILVSCY